MISGFIADCANNTFGFILDIIIDADNAEILFAMEEGGFGPADIIGNPVFQKLALNHFFAF